MRLYETLDIAYIYYENLRDSLEDTKHWIYANQEIQWTFKVILWDLKTIEGFTQNLDILYKVTRLYEFLRNFTSIHEIRRDIRPF